MTIAHSVRAVYEDGWLKPVEPLLLPDRQRVEILVTVLEEPQYRADPKLVQQPTRKPMSGWLSSLPLRCGNHSASLRPRRAAWTQSSGS